MCYGGPLLSKNQGQQNTYYTPTFLVWETVIKGTVDRCMMFNKAM